ncbi:MAG: TatD family hydrolase [Candidatus Rokubacteria bacterium]|nr:TatD family hydrolase [Candidatus Rokubacteria bacterium]
MVLFDTHAHLHFEEFDADRPLVLERARGAGVRRFLTIGIDVETSRSAVALAEAEADCFAAVGLHPHEASKGTDATWIAFRQLAASPKVVALGEMGLDFFRNLSPRDEQVRAFRRQIRLARELGKPILIHCREAHAEVLVILQEEGARELGGIMHCFSGDAEFAKACLELGFLISIAGPVTYPNARKLPEVVRAVPQDRLVLETDCPYLPPQPHRGQRNEPAYLTHTARRVADLLGLTLEEVAEVTTASACRLLAIPPP